jgi:hypothetical protein
MVVVGSGRGKCSYYEALIVGFPMASVVFLVIMFDGSGAIDTSENSIVICQAHLETLHHGYPDCTSDSFSWKVEWSGIDLRLVESPHGSTSMSDELAFIERQDFQASRLP